MKLKTLLNGIYFVLKFEGKTINFTKKGEESAFFFTKKQPYVSRFRTVASEKVYRRILNTDSRLPATILLQSIPNTCLFVDLPRRSIGTNRQTDTKTPYSINI